MNKKISIWYLIIGAIILIVLFKQCEGETKTIVKTETIIEKVVDTIKTVEIKEVPKEVIVNRYINKEGEKVIVYVDKENDSSIVANNYKTKLKSNNAIANLEIVTTGELLDVKGTIEYNKETTITTIKEYKDKSGLFIYGSTPINTFNSVEIGLMYQFKNKVGIMGGVNYNSATKQPEVKVGLLIKI